MQYLAAGELDGTSITLTETVVFDGTFSILVLQDENPAPEDWRMGPVASATPSIVRTRTIRPSDATLVSATFAVPLHLGEFPAPGGMATMVPRDGSQIVLTAPTGAFRATAPATTATQPSSDGAEETTIPVDGDVTAFSLTVLADPLRNPAGHWFYEAVAWGPLPWVIGALVAFVGSVLWDRMLRLVGLSGRRRPTQPASPPPTTGSEHGTGF